MKLNIKIKEAEFDKLTKGSLNKPSLVKIVVIKSIFINDTTSKAAAFRAVKCVDIYTTISTIIVAVDIISFVITIAIFNQGISSISTTFMLAYT